MSWNNNPIRRGQLVMPFGPGNLFVSKTGVSMMIGGIDHWFVDKNLDKNEFIVRDWRLEAELGVNEFRLPPDYRTNFNRSNTTNINLTVPALRFPQYHICSNCKLLQTKALEQAQYAKCRDCAKENKPHKLNQVRFIAICQKGHIQDFPWREWVHKSGDQTCDGDLYYRAGRGASLDNISIYCKKCQASENLTSSIFNAQMNEYGVVESSSLQGLISNIQFKCKGTKPWLGDSIGCECDSPPIAALRGAGNVYFGLTRSSLSLPKSDDVLLQSICDEIESNSNLRLRVDLPRAFFEIYSRNNSQDNKNNFNERLKEAAEDIADILVNAGKEDISLIMESITLIIKKETPKTSEIPSNREMREIAFRREEYEILQKAISHQNLVIETINMKEYDIDESHAALMEGIDHISLIKKLIETTALEGFTRLNPSRMDDFKADIMLDRNKGKIKWLPARQSTGEGIFIRFNEEILKKWENNRKVIDRVANLKKNISSSLLFNQSEGLASPRHVLLHTFAHCLINELTYSSGYGSSSLRERLYISDDPNAPMSGVMIYTASGDSEGSMGGLVTQGRPNIFSKLLNRALTKSSWCSHDPVCAIGKDTGPDSCNNSACYSCCILPEPSCEISNAGLDRALLGTRAVGFKDIAYFVPLEER